MTVRFPLCLFICETRKICIDSEDTIHNPWYGREGPGLETERAVGKKSLEGYFTQGTLVALYPNWESLHSN